MINFRTSWFVTLQSFLFISFALSFGKIVGFGGVISAIIFAYVGINVCRTTHRGVIAANQAIDETWKHWGRVKKVIDPDNKLPALKGGLGRPDGPISNSGSISSLKLPKYLKIAWFALLGVSIWNYIAGLVSVSTSVGQ